MDFKVAGTADTVTALQLDTKIDGLPSEVLAQALQQAKVARLKILDVITAAIPEPRGEVAAGAPKIVSFEIPIDKIGEVIGPKGKVINTLQQETGADIAVDDDGMVGTVTIGAQGRHRGRRGATAHRDDPRPADRRRRGGLLGSGREPDQVRRVREHPPGPRRPAAHLEALAAHGRQAREPGRRRPHAWASRSRCASTTSTPRGRSRSRSPADVAAGGRGDRLVARSVEERGRRVRTRVQRAAAVDASRSPSRPSSKPSSVTWARRASRSPRTTGTGARGTAAAAGSPGRAGRDQGGPRASRQRVPARHRARRRRALGVARGLRRRWARATSPSRVAGASHFLEHLLFKGTERLDARRSPRPSTASAASPTPTRPASSPASGCASWARTSTSGCRSSATS